MIGQAGNRICAVDRGTEAARMATYARRRKTLKTFWPMHTGLITIGQLAREARVTPRAIRHYERLGLIEAPIRTEANYRLFDSDSVARLRFIAKCRSLGFSIPEVSDLLRIMEDPDHTCAQVADLTRQHLDLVDSKIKDLAEMRRTLARNLARCTGKEVPDCPVLEFLQKPT